LFVDSMVLYSLSSHYHNPHHIYKFEKPIARKKRVKKNGLIKRNIW